MNNKTVAVLSSLVFLTLSLSIGLVGCKEKKDIDSAKAEKVRPIIDFDQDEDPYPDDYILEEVPDPNDKVSNKKTKKKTKSFKTTEALKGHLENAFPGVKIEKVSKGPVPYLYEVKTEGDVFFTTTDGQLMFVGDLIDLQDSKLNYTEKARTADRYALLKKLNVNDTINFVPKNPKYTVIVFTDTDCGYCRKFHQHIQELNTLGIGVQYAAFPRAGLESKTFDNMQSIWCAKDKNAAYTSAIMGNPVLASKESCSTQLVQNQFHLGQKLGLRGTPALVLQDGSLIPGYMPPDALKAMLDKHFEKK